MKKINKKVSRKRLIDKNWELCRQIKFELVGRRCEICGSANNLQVDHCFSRRNKKLFYNIRNLTVLCSSCHCNKSYRQKAMDLRVYEHVEAREGILVFSGLRAMDESMSEFPEWQYLWYHEEQNQELTKELHNLKMEGCQTTVRGTAGTPPEEPDYE